jgi:hypothetical protein
MPVSNIGYRNTNAAPVSDTVLTEYNTQSVALQRSTTIRRPQAHTRGDGGDRHD